jgi:DNA-binding GntR family transcriptional regulator
MSVKEKLPPLRLDRTRHAAPQVFERLRELIVSLELAPGTLLPRPELAERFGVSQTPVRDALLKLGEEGLVDIFPQHATVVSRIDVKSARQAHFLRLSLELEVVCTLAALPERKALMDRLRGHIDVQAATLSPSSVGAFSAADQAFHHDMYEAAGVSELYALVRRHSGHVDRLRRLHLPSEGKALAVVRDHKRIVDAIAKGDAGLAQERLRAHLSGTLSQVDDIVRRHPGFIAA